MLNIKNIEYELVLAQSLDLMDDAIIIANNCQEVIYVNKQAINLLLINRDNIIGTKLSDIYNHVSDYDSSHLIRNFTSLLKVKNGIDEKIIQLNNGDNISILEKRKTISIDEKNNFTLYIIKDATDKRELEERAIESSNVYLKIFEEFPALICRTNNEGLFNYFNNSWLSFTGTEIHENIHINWFSLIHKDDFDQFYKLFNENFDRLTEFHTEIRLKDKDNKYKWIYFYFKPFEGLNGKVAGFLGMGLDITERKLSEEKMREAMIEAQKASEAKSSFLSNMSHELRTPLNGVLGMTEVLLDSNPTKEQKMFLSVQKNSANSLLAIINSILDLSKIESGSLETYIQSFNVKNFINDFVQYQRPIVALKGLELNISISENVPDNISTDSIKLKQILINLVGNSIKFTEKGAISISLDFSSGQNKSEFLFAVKDTGIGIKKEFFNSIFNSFEQVDNTYTRKYDGTGLGLAISKQIVHLLDGRIWVDSIEGAGSTFYFTIPLNEEKL
ncbi:MAG: PAS domain S-box protein [Melioribacteraceae bacterium]|nr:PAS domain S-box protein [Melioribacteraceae bacterium]